MKFLVDTEVLLWAAADSKRLTPEARAMLSDAGNQLFFSAASLWEVAIKNSLGRADLVVEPRGFRRLLLDNGYVELPITSQHAVTTDLLPDIHKDPFDRMLIAQAMTEGMAFLTADRRLTRYPGSIRRI